MQHCGLINGFNRGGGIFLQALLGLVLNDFVLIIHNLIGCFVKIIRYFWLEY